MMQLVLGYKNPPGESPYWFDDSKRKFIRVIAGLMLPQLERQVGVVVILGELYRSSGPVDLTGFAATVGMWPEVENALAQLRKDIKFDHIITENEGARKLLWRASGITYGVSEIPITTYSAPEWAATEVARQKVDAMIDEGRLHIDDISPILDREPEQGLRALQCAVSWMLDNKAVYITKKIGTPQSGGGWLGTVGL